MYNGKTFFQFFKCTYWVIAQIIFLSELKFLGDFEWILCTYVWNSFMVVLISLWPNITKFVLLAPKSLGAHLLARPYSSAITL